MDYDKYTTISYIEIHFSRCYRDIVQDCGSMVENAVGRVINGIDLLISKNIIGRKKLWAVQKYE